MKTLLIIVNLTGGQPAIIDYPTAPACETAAKLLLDDMNTSTSEKAYPVRTSCIPAPTNN